MATITVQELWACANIIIETHGDGAPLFVAERLGALALAQDMDGIAVWKNIAGKIAALKRPPVERPRH